MKPTFNALGRHILVEFHGCSAEVLNDVPRIENSMINAAKKAGATVISSSFHHFSPFGVSGVVVIQESHLAIHTWPEYRYAAVDLFTCGNTVSPWISYELLKQAFEAENGSAIEINRGQLELLERSDIDVGELRDEATQKLMVPKYSRSVWFTDRDENIALSIRHKGDRLFWQKSPYQSVEVYDTFEYGKLLAIDSKVMCTERDEHGYHEMITHIPLLVHPEAKRVLIIGGGDGGTAREVLRHPHIEAVTLVEIDAVVIEASKQFLPSISSAFDHPKLNVIVGDGIQYLADAPAESFDVILIDSSDPEGPAVGLFNPDFYKGVYRCLTPQGIMVSQSESPRFNERAMVGLYQSLQKIFEPEAVHCYLAFIATYPTGMWSFTYATKGGSHPLANLDDAKATAFAEAAGLQYYNAAVHRAAFALPTFVQQMLKG